MSTHSSSSAVSSFHQEVERQFNDYVAWVAGPDKDEQTHFLAKSIAGSMPNIMQYVRERKKESDDYLVHDANRMQDLKETIKLLKDQAKRLRDSGVTKPWAVIDKRWSEKDIPNTNAFKLQMYLVEHGVEAMERKAFRIYTHRADASEHQMLDDTAKNQVSRYVNDLKEYFDRSYNDLQQLIQHNPRNPLSAAAQQQAETLIKQLQRRPATAGKTLTVELLKQIRKPYFSELMLQEFEYALAASQTPMPLDEDQRVSGTFRIVDEILDASWPDDFYVVTAEGARLSMRISGATQHDDAQDLASFEACIHAIRDGGTPSPALLGLLYHGFNGMMSGKSDAATGKLPNEEARIEQNALGVQYFVHYLPQHAAELAAHRAVIPVPALPDTPPEMPQAIKTFSAAQAVQAHDTIHLHGVMPAAALSSPGGVRNPSAPWSPLAVGSEALDAMDAERKTLLLRYADKHAALFHVLGINAPESKHGDQLGGTRTRVLNGNDPKELRLRSEALAGVSSKRFQPMLFYSGYSGRENARLNIAHEDIEKIYKALVMRDPQPGVDPVQRHADFVHQVNDYFACKAEVANFIAVPPKGRFMTRLPEAQQLRVAYDAYESMLLQALTETDASTPRSLLDVARLVEMNETSLNQLQAGELTKREVTALLAELQHHLFDASALGVSVSDAQQAAIEQAKSALIEAAQNYREAVLPCRIIIADRIADQNEIFLKNRAHGTGLHVHRLYGRVERETTGESTDAFMARLTDTEQLAAAYLSSLSGIYQLLGSADPVRVFEHSGNYLEQLPRSTRAALAAQPETALLLHPTRLDDVGSLDADVAALKQTLMPQLSDNSPQAIILMHLIEHAALLRAELRDAGVSQSMLEELGPLVAQHMVHATGNASPDQKRESHRTTGHLLEWLSEMGGVDPASFKNEAKKSKFFKAFADRQTSHAQLLI